MLASIPPDQLHPPHFALRIVTITNATTQPSLFGVAPSTANGTRQYGIDIKTLEAWRWGFIAALLINQTVRRTKINADAAILTSKPLHAPVRSVSTHRTHPH